MKIYGKFCFPILILLITIPANAQRDTLPQRLKRSESFLGIHFDFRANKYDRNIGKNTTPKMVRAILDKVKPDYIQIDRKGHEGYTSYPTKVGKDRKSVV